MNELTLRQKLQTVAYGLLFCTLLGGCGGALQNNNGSASPAPGQTTQSATVTQFRVGDAPADQVFSFAVTIGSTINLISMNGGNAVSIQVNPNRLELSHTANNLQALGITALTPGSYSAADITIQHPSVTYTTTLFMPGPVTLIDSIDGTDQTVRVNFNPPLVVGKDPIVLNLDVDLASALTANNAGDITGISFTGSSFTFAVQPVGITGQQQDDTGEFESETGMAVNVSAGNLVLQTGQSGSRLPFAVDAATRLPIGLQLADLENRIIQVEGYTRPDGTLYAEQIEMMGDQNASEMEGTVTQVGSFNVATMLEFIAQDGSGAGFTSDQVGQDFFLDISSVPATDYATDYGDCDESALQSPTVNFPFDASHLKAGQRIAIVTESGLSTNPVSATQVRLQQQAISGTVANFTALPGGTASFDLLLPADSYLTLLSGETTVHIVEQTKTDSRVENIANGNVVRVRGPLFWTGTQFNMVARRITK